MIRKTFDELLEIITPIVMANTPDTTSCGKAREIAEDVTYMINRGKSTGMINAPEIPRAGK